MKLPDPDLLLEWLAIPIEDYPPNHYQLLGVRMFETNPEVIRNAADRQYSHVKRLAINKFADAGQKLLEQITVAKICLLDEDQRTEYDTQLASNSDVYELLVGADPQCDIRLNDSCVSSVHCKIVRKQEQVHVRDLGSTNGTFINVRKITRAVLQPADVITLGPTTLLNLPKVFLPHAFHNANLRVIGRSPHCHVELNHPSVSHIHAKIYRHGMQDVIEDLNSTNGTNLVVGERLEPVKGRMLIGPATAIVFGTHRVATATLR